MTDAERLELYENAEAAILGGGQEYEANGVKISRAQLREIQHMIPKLRASVARAASGSVLPFGGTAIFGERN